MSSIKVKEELFARGVTVGFPEREMFAVGTSTTFDTTQFNVRFHGNFGNQLMAR